MADCHTATLGRLIHSMIPVLSPPLFLVMLTLHVHDNGGAAAADDDYDDDGVYQSQPFPEAPALTVSFLLEGRPHSFELTLPLSVCSFIEPLQVGTPTVYVFDFQAVGFPWQS